MTGWLWSALLLQFACAPLLAQAPAAADSPQAPVSKVPTADYSKEPYVFELIESKIHFGKDGKGQRDLSVRVRVQSESAVRELGLQVYPYDSAFESLDVLSAKVQKPDGTVVDTPPSDVQELDSAVSREAPMYTDQREKHIAVKSLSIGDILEVKLRWTIHDPIAPGYFWYDTSYFHDGICLKEVVEISVPRDLPIHLKYSSPEPSTHDDGNIRTYTFQTSNLEKTKKSKIPAWEKDFHGAAPPELRISSFSSWESVGAWYNTLQQSRLAVSPEIRSRAEELTKGKSTDDEKIQAIYEFVSTRFRYIGVDLGIGRYSPHSASDVLANRYGDCKDKHTLFAALLQAVGIQAYPAVISTKFRIDPTLPSMSLFDHMITAIPRGASFLFLDTTPEVAPCGLLMAVLRDRHALVIPSNGPAHLVTTPADPAVPNKELVRIEGSLDPKGTLDASFSIEEHGDAEVVLRGAYRATPQNKWQELTQNLAQRMGFGGTVSDASITPPEDTSKPLRLTFTYHRIDFPDWKDRRIVLPSPFFFLPELNEDQKLSKDPLPVGSSQDVTYDTTVKLPEGFTAVLPEEVTRKPAFGSFTARYTTEKPNVIHGVLHLQLSQREIPGAQRSAFDEFAKTVREAPTRYIFVKGEFPADASEGPESPILARGPYPPNQGIARLEQLAEANPDNQQIRSALVMAYIKDKQPEKALGVLDKFVAKNPQGTPNSNYLYGRTYLALQDRDKAYTYFQKALGDDPDPLTLNNVAWDLSEAGIHPKEALEYSKRSVEDIAKETMDASADDPKSSDFQFMPVLAAFWDTLGWIHFQGNELPEARKYLEAAWQLSLDPAKGEHLVELYEKMGESRKAASVCMMALGGVSDPDTDKKLKAAWTRLKSSSSIPASRNDLKMVASDGSIALSETRTVKVAFHAKLQGNSRSAEAVISIVNGPKVDNVTIVSGADELRNAVADIAAAKYPLSFPDDTPVRILRKATLSCSAYTKTCLLILIPIRDAAVSAAN
jgi:tetratricopeptide (TPR) repeat protein